MLIEVALGLLYLGQEIICLFLSSILVKETRAFREEPDEGDNKGRRYSLKN